MPDDDESEDDEVVVDDGVVEAGVDVEDDLAVELLDEELRLSLR
ncbi:hypothetical protein GCM10010094_83360 [Streptomyces flaveus]|uniref:Uncharacterized protein n=1 Tax=Streptomyces flaveus TaxID=66370 RepID=A0A917RJD5_9ACTN|nr:hypothetical protein GCM10010094_83360 [Streptomyces flaveus]